MGNCRQKIKNNGLEGFRGIRDYYPNIYNRGWREVLTNSHFFLASIDFMGEKKHGDKKPS